MTKDEIFSIVKKNIIEILPDIPEEAIEIHQRLKDLGANSIDRMEIVTMTMEALRIKVPLVEFGEIKNIEGLVNFFHEKAKLN
ncbi:MAG: acyl carrier protein [bacterium]